VGGSIFFSNPQDKLLSIADDVLEIIKIYYRLQFVHQLDGCTKQG